MRGAAGEHSNSLVSKSSSVCCLIHKAHPRLAKGYWAGLCSPARIIPRQENKSTFCGVYSRPGDTTRRLRRQFKNFKRASGMADSVSKRKFFETTRGQIVRLLCSGARTVTELAEQLRLSENAVRSHLASLGREGLVDLSGKQPGTRKPHFSYELSPKAHDLFSKGYEPVLLELLEVLSRRENIDDLALKTGRRVIQMYLPKLRRQKPAARLKTIVSRATEAGIPLSLVQEDGQVLIRGCSCPLTTVTSRKPELCNVIARLLSETLEQPVEQQCNHQRAPRCEFRLKRPRASRAAKSGA
jgi:DeoR family suf operon transcriptional repressor